MDKTRALNIMGGATDQGEMRIIKWRSSRKHMMYFNANGGAAITDINKGALLLCVYSDAVANGPLFKFDALVRFKDA